MNVTDAVEELPLLGVTGAVFEVPLYLNVTVPAGGPPALAVTVAVAVKVWPFETVDGLSVSVVVVVMVAL